MFDLGFWELIAIMIVALLVIGPERLPGVARKAGMWVGRTKRFMRTVKDDIDRELAAEELRRVLKEQSESSGVHEIVEETKGSLEDTKNAIDQSQNTFNEAEHDYLVSAAKGEPQASRSSDESESESENRIAKPSSSPADDQENQER